MFPMRFAVLLLTLLSLAFWAAPSSFGQRRVFTNDDFPSPAPPPAAPAPAETAAAPAEGTSAAEGAPSSSEEAAETAEEFPSGLGLAQSLQANLRRFRSESATLLEEGASPARQERLQIMLDLANQLLTQNQLYIAELQAEQEQAEAEAQAQAGAP